MNLQKTSVLAVSLLMLLAAMPFEAQAQIGPPAPQEKPPNPTLNEKMGDVKEKFIQLFSPQQEAVEEDEYTVEEVRKGAGMPGQFDTVKRRVRKTPANTPADEQQAARTAPSRPPLLSQPPLRNPEVNHPEISVENPPQELPALDNPENPFGFADAQKKLNATAALIEKKDYAMAKSLLLPLKDWLVESTESHISLYKALNNVPSAKVQAELEKQVALEFALLRDKAFFQLGKIYLAENDSRTGIKMLIEVVKSQPRSETGLKAYELLQEIGFTQKLQLVE